MEIKLLSGRITSLLDALRAANPSNALGRAA